MLRKLIEEIDRENNPALLQPDRTSKKMKMSHGRDVGLFVFNKRVDKKRFCEELDKKGIVWSNDGSKIRVKNAENFIDDAEALYEKIVVG